MRPDLVVRPQQVGGDRYWVVKDPVALAYFHLRDEEHAILRMLDGRATLEEIRRRFEQLFAPLELTAEHLHAFLGRLHACNLVLADSPGQGHQMLLRHHQRRRRERLQWLGSVLAIRFRGIDPEPLLERLYPKVRWLFSPPAVAAAVLLVLAAVALAAVQYGVFQSRLPDLRAFLSVGNVVWLAASLAAAKVLHELGHALACKHFGGECHEMGVMLLVFTPCLWCNVSDAWMLSSKWQRVAISMAGIGVELVLAALCTFVWWFSEPGLLNTLALNMMVICSVNTVLFNGNPLLRYDGYYVLSDVLEVPNLGQQSRALLSRSLARLVLGVELPADRSLPGKRRWLLAAYGVASTAYRWFVVLAILWFCHEVLSAYRLEVVASLLAAAVVAGLLAVPVANVIGLLRNPAWTRKVRRGRAALAGVALAVVLAAVLLAPLPYRVAAPVVLEPQGGCRVYVSVPGTLTRSLKAGAVVERGETLAELEDLDVRRQIEELAGERDRQRLRLANLEAQLVEDPSVAPQIPAAREALADVEVRLRQRQQDQERLSLKSPLGGTVLPPPLRPARPYAQGRLENWWGSPLDTQNLGCHLTTGTLFCLVGDPGRLEAVLVVDQSDLAFVKPGQRARVRLAELPDGVLGGTVAEIAKTGLEIVPRELALGKALPTRFDEDGIARPLEPCYRVRVRLDEHERPLLVGTAGRAKILADPQPLGQRLYRYLRRTFNFPL